MTQLLIVYYRALHEQWLPTYIHSLKGFRQHSDAECVYLNAAHRHVPECVRELNPDLVVFHYTLPLRRQWPDEYAGLVDRLAFLRELDCRKAMIAQDEQVRMDLLNLFVKDFGITHIFSPAPSATWPLVYRDVDTEKVRIRPILNGYVDEVTLRRVERRSRVRQERPIDIGYRSWYTQPFYGRHGQLKQQIGKVFKERAPEYGLVVDIANEYKDALWGDRWFDFLLSCKYTIGVEGGCGVFDWDGSIASYTLDYVRDNEGASFEAIEAACFPGADGQFAFHTLSPRHLEAIMTRTCQILVEGEYGGILKPGRHYIELKKDFSNLDRVLSLVRTDELREGIVERAYADIVDSGAYTFRALIEFVLSESLMGLGQIDRTTSLHSKAQLLWHRCTEGLWALYGAVYRETRRRARIVISALLGEQRLLRVMGALRRSAGR